MTNHLGPSIMEMLEAKLSELLAVLGECKALLVRIAVAVEKKP